MFINSQISIMNVATEKIILLETSNNEKIPEHLLDCFHLHLFCHSGRMNFVFNERPYVCKAGSFVFWFADSNVLNIAFSPKFKASVLLVEKEFLNDNLPNQSWSINALLHSRENPVLLLNNKIDNQRILSNFHILYQKFLETEHRFYDEVLRLQMQLFIFEMWHTFANEYEHYKRTMESGSLYERFMQLAQEECNREREVQYYAGRLNITAKYLNYICKQNTDITASEWIQRFVRERIVLLIHDKDLNISEISDAMNFSSRSYFTRYVKKTLGATPKNLRNKRNKIS